VNCNQRENTVFPNEMDGKQPVDAASTATKAPKKERKQYPKNGSIQWGRIKKEWEAGASPTTLAYRHGITYDAVYKRIKREGWERREPAAVQEVSQPVNQPIAMAVKERLGRHFQQVLNQVETLQRGIDEHSSRRLEVEELKTLSTTLDNLDRIARRTFGLDGPGGGSPGSLLATVAPAVLCPIIEAEVAPVAPLPPPAG